MKDFSYIKDWISYERPRPIILECEVSQSGMSMAVWDRDRKIFTVGGCGFDRVGVAIARVLEHCWRAELECANLEGLHGARRHSGGVTLEGMAGWQSMCEVGARIGLKIAVYDSRHGSIIHITAA